MLKNYFDIVNAENTLNATVSKATSDILNSVGLPSDINELPISQVVKDNKSEYHEAMSRVRAYINANNYTLPRSEYNKDTGIIESYEAGELPRNMSLIPGTSAPRTQIDKVMATLESYNAPNQVLPINNIPQNTTPDTQAITQTLAQASTNTQNAINKVEETIKDTQNKNWERAKLQSRNALYSSIASGVASIYEDISNYKQNVKNIDFETQMTAKQIDTNLANYEAALSDQLSVAMADLDVSAAMKNVDLSSQAIAGAKEGGLIQMGKDIQNETTKSKLQKAALNLSATYQKTQLQRNKTASIQNALNSITSSYLNYKSYDVDDYKLSSGIKTK